MPATESTALAVVDRVSGEKVEVATAETERLAAFCTNLAELRSVLSEEESLVSAELVRRLDRDASWTLRVGDPSAQQWEITAPSSADVVTYPERSLEQKLLVLLADDRISETAAAAALKRTLTIEVSVPFDSSKTLEELAQALPENATIEIAGIPVWVAKVTSSRKTVAAGIAKLRKVPAAAAALDAVMETREAGGRRAKVKLKVRS